MGQMLPFFSSLPAHTNYRKEREATIFLSCKRIPAVYEGGSAMSREGQPKRQRDRLIRTARNQDPFERGAADRKA